MRGTDDLVVGVKWEKEDFKIYYHETNEGESRSSVTNTVINDYSGWFFLPAAGDCSAYHGLHFNTGEMGGFWSSTPYSDSSYAYALVFSSNLVMVGCQYPFTREFGVCLWSAQ